MNGDHLTRLLSLVASGEVSPEEALGRLKHMPFTDLGFACADTHRELRQGFPETIYSPGKSACQIVEVARSLLDHSAKVFATRVLPEQVEEILSAFPAAYYHESARVFVIGDLNHRDPALSKFRCAVVSAGTADLNVAEEACLILEYSGVSLQRIFDVGVAGIHRLLDRTELLMKQDCLIVVAGMDGALPSVVGGLVACPVIAVPTSVGYGAGSGGIAPLLTMLNSCAAGITVVNIDNGYGAAMAALRYATVSRDPDY